MNLYFRMIFVFIKIWLSPKKRWYEDSVLHFRVYPFDCDINFHLTSSRYLGIADLGRIHLLGQMGIFRSVLKNGYFPIASGIEITYIRPIRPFQKFTLRSRITNWDDKYCYLEHIFEAGNQVCAIAIFRGVFVKNHSTVSINKIASLTGENPESPAPSETIRQWKKLLKAKKEEFSSDNTRSKN